MKISVIGPSGSGKSVLSRKISSEFNLPRLEIDRLWFTCGGNDLFLNGGTDEEKELVDRKIQYEVEQFLAKHENWVIDGTYMKIQPIIADQADTVVFINRPLLYRVVDHFLRILKNEHRHPETSTWQDIRFSTTIIRRWLKNENTKLEKFVKRYEPKLVRLSNFKEINKYFDSLNPRIKSH